MSKLSLTHQPIQAKVSCNCRHGPTSCPVQRKCLTDSVVYRASVTQTQRHILGSQATNLRRGDTSITATWWMRRTNTHVWDKHSCLGAKWQNDLFNPYIWFYWKNPKLQPNNQEMSSLLKGEVPYPVQWEQQSLKKTRDFQHMQTLKTKTSWEFHDLSPVFGGFFTFKYRNVFIFASLWEPRLYDRLFVDKVILNCVLWQNMLSMLPWNSIWLK